jgi:hypothetical protein
VLLFRSGLRLFHSGLLHVKTLGSIKDVLSDVISWVRFGLSTLMIQMVHRLLCGKRYFVFRLWLIKRLGLGHIILKSEWLSPSVQDRQ